ncbi:hypothetical protein ACOMHN_032627 [Nucella lapillus]
MGTDDTDEFIGCKATFRVKKEDNILSAEIQNIDKTNKTLTFYKVTVHEPGKPDKVFGGLQQYHIDELTDLTVSEDEVNHALRRASLGKPVERNPLQRSTKKRIIRNEKFTPRHLEKLIDLDATSLYMMKIVEGEMESSRNEDGEYESKLPADCTLLDDSSSKLFREAVSTEVHTMFFDIKSLGKDGFDTGLNGFLQSTKVVKVIHDCRRPSDLLFHQYGISLRNVFDTQVGSVHSFKLMNGSFPRYVTNLASCLQCELHLKDEDIHVPFLREHDPQKDEEVWNLRPAPSIVYDWMLRHCRHLLALRSNQMVVILMEFNLGVDIYLKSLRQVYSSEAEGRRSSQHLLPMEYVDLPLVLKARLQEEKHLQKKVRGRHEDTVHKDHNGWVENWTGIAHPMLKGGCDTIWHMKSAPPKRASEKPQGSKKETGAAHSIAGSSPSGDAMNNHQQDPTSRKESVVKNVMENNPDSSDPGRPKGSGTDVSTPTPSVVTGTPQADTESSPRNPVADVLREATRKHQQKENRASVFQDRAYMLRPAGKEALNISKKEKQRELKSLRCVNGDDLASKAATSSHPLRDQDISHEFDIIPCQSKLLENRSKQTVSHDGFVSAPDQEDTAPTIKGFDITTFKEAVPPPPYTVSEQTGRSCAEEALAAILPRVEDPSLLLEGSRATYYLKQSSGRVRQKHLENGAATATGSRGAVSGDNSSSKPVSKSGGSLTNSHAGSHHCALDSENSATKRAESASRTLFRSHVRDNGFGAGTSSDGSGLVRDCEFLSLNATTPDKTASVASHSNSSSPPTPRLTQETGTSVCSSPQTVPSSGPRAQSDCSSSSPTPPSVLSCGAQTQTVCPSPKSAPCSVPQAQTVCPSPKSVPCSVSQAQTVAEVGVTDANSLCQSPARSSGTLSSSSSSGASSPSSVSYGSQTPRSGLPAASSLSISEIRKAIASGESVMSILGYKKPPQQMVSSRFKHTLEKKDK